MCVCVRNMCNSTERYWLRAKLNEWLQCNYQFRIQWLTIWPCTSFFYSIQLDIIFKNNYMNGLKCMWWKLFVLFFSFGWSGEGLDSLPSFYCCLSPIGRFILAICSRDCCHWNRKWDDIQSFSNAIEARGGGKSFNWATHSKQNPDGKTLKWFLFPSYSQKKKVWLLVHFKYFFYLPGV